MIKPKLKLIDDWRHSWKFGSVWLAWAAGAISTAIIGYAPSLVVQFLQSDFRTRIVIGAMLGFAMVAGAWSSRIFTVKKGSSDAC